MGGSEKLSLQYVLEGCKAAATIIDYAKEQGYRSNVTRSEMDALLKQCKDAGVLTKAFRVKPILDNWPDEEEEEEEEEEEVEAPKRARDDEDEEDDIFRVVMMCAAVYPIAKAEGNHKFARKCYNQAVDLLEPLLDEDVDDDEEDYEEVVDVVHDDASVSVGTRFNMLHPGADAGDHLKEIGSRALNYYVQVYGELPEKQNKRGNKGSYIYPLSRCHDTVDKAIAEIKL